MNFTGQNYEGYLNDFGMSFGHVHKNYFVVNLLATTNRPLKLVTKNNVCAHNEMQALLTTFEIQSQ